MSKSSLPSIVPDDDFQHVKIINHDLCLTCRNKVCLSLCPSEVFQNRNTDENYIQVFYRQCIECGACRIGCPLLNIDFYYPRSGYGVIFYEG